MKYHHYSNMNLCVYVWWIYAWHKFYGSWQCFMRKNLIEDFLPMQAEFGRAFDDILICMEMHIRCFFPCCNYIKWFKAFSTNMPWVRGANTRNYIYPWTMREHTHTHTQRYEVAVSSGTFLNLATSSHGCCRVVTKSIFYLH